jgi:hypothetical protein
MGNNPQLIRRHAESQVIEALADTPVVLIHGPRQAGKSTLAQTVGRTTEARYVTLDDPIPRSLALDDPQGFVQAYPGPVIVDEVQRAPGLFLAIKASVDRDRRPGRFLLTGSANVLSLPKIADSLAGRMAIIDLLPFSQAELEARPPSFIERLFGRSPLDSAGGPVADVIARALRGGFPEAHARTSASRRDAWFSDYLRTLLERDVRDLANIEGLAQMPRLLKLLAARVGAALNVVDLSRETQIPNTSLHRYLDLLEAIFLIHPVRAWSTDQEVRLIKTAKLFLVDSGLMGYLLNAGPSQLADDPDKLRPVLENFVANEIRKLSLASPQQHSLYHLRTVRRLQVDLVVENRSGEVSGIQVRPGTTVRPQDTDGLQLLRELAGENFRKGLVLYMGNRTEPLAPNIFAVPVSSLWH